MENVDGMCGKTKMEPYDPLKKVNCGLPSLSTVAYNTRFVPLHLIV